VLGDPADAWPACLTSATYRSISRRWWAVRASAPPNNRWQLQTPWAGMVALRACRV